MNEEEYIDSKTPKTIQDVLAMSSDDENAPHWIYEEFGELLLHRFNCIECQYNDYLCKDANPSLLENIEKAFFGDKTLNDILNEWSNEYYMGH